MIPRVRPSYTLEDARAIFFPARDALAELERALAQHFGVRDAILFPYGRSAIYAVLRAMDLRGNVVQPAYNCVVVAHATVTAECAPVFVDCENTNPNQDADAMLDAVNAETAAVIPTSIFGHTFDAPQLVASIRRKNKNAFVLLDCAQAFTTRWQNELLAVQGDAAILAFGVGKAMTTLFGGAVLTMRAEVAARVREWRAHKFSAPTLSHLLLHRIYFAATWAATSEWGTVLTDWVENSGVLKTILFKNLRSREAIRLPKNNQTHLSRAAAALGVTQLMRLDAFLARRRAISEIYARELQSCAEVELPIWADGATHTIYTLRLTEPEMRRAILDGLSRRGVQGGAVLDYVTPDLQCYHERGYERAYPNARAWAERALNLPNHPSMTDAQAEKCARVLRETLQENQRARNSIAHYERNFS